MATIGHAVVLLDSEECDDYPDTRCIMAVIQADSREEAEEIRRHIPRGFAPHVVRVATADEYQIREVRALGGK